MNGFIILDKPAHLSSAAAVNRVKRLLPHRTKIGHAGTLDPFATGVLVLLIGKGTTYCERLMDQPKQYEATIKFGATTATDDPESPEQPYDPDPPDPDHADPSNQPWRSLEATPSEAKVRALLPRFVGPIQQRPPAFSALKVGGRRAYDLARHGEQVQLAPRTVQVYAIHLLQYDWPHLRLRIDCGRGTYIRSLARDIGESLEVGGYLTQLRRTRVGEYATDRAVTLEQLADQGVERHLIPLP